MATAVLSFPKLESDRNRFSSVFSRRPHIVFTSLRNAIYRLYASPVESSKARLDAAEKILDGPPHQSYLSAIDQVIVTVKNPGTDEMKDRAVCSLHRAMFKLMPVFRSNLLNCSIPLNLDSFDDAELESLIDPGVDLTKPDVLVLLKDIADRMIRGGFAKELLELYIGARCEVLNKYWMIPELLEGLSLEEIEKWNRAVKITSRVLLSVEKFIADHIFSGFDRIRDTCFKKIARTSLMPLIKFGEAAAPKLCQKPIMILEMYATWENAMPEEMCAEVNGLSSGLGAFAKRALLDSLSFISKTNETLRGGPPTLNGDIHPANKALMSYLLPVAKFRNHLDPIFRDDVIDMDSSTGRLLLLEGMTPLSKRLFMPISILVSSMEEKSKGYGDNALQNIFLMNNVLYIAQKVTDSELENGGHHLVRNWHGQICQYTTNYLRATWSKPLVCLKDEGIGGDNRAKLIRTMLASNPALLKKRLKIFNACFEEIYGTQTAWKVPDPQLRAELQAAILEKVLPAYRSFLRINGKQLESVRKHIKYTPEDLESSVYDLFEGSPKQGSKHMRAYVGWICPSTTTHMEGCSR